jgi:uncharacterized membrane protein
MSVHVKGHPYHVILVAFPIGLFTFAWIFDIVYGLTGIVAWYTASYLNLLFGVLTAVPTMITGAMDYTLIRDERAKGVATQHLLVTGISFLAFILSLLIRSVHAQGFAAPISGPDYYQALFLSCAGVLTLSIGGWLGGELVYRHRMGVGIEPVDHDVPKPLADEAGNVANDLPDFPSPEPA